jgi:hypothetical protein
MGGSEAGLNPRPTPIPPTKVAAATNNATPVHALVGRVRFIVSMKLGDPNSFQSSAVGASDAGATKVGTIGGGAIDGAAIDCAAVGGGGISGCVVVADGAVVADGVGVAEIVVGNTVDGSGMNGSVAVADGIAAGVATVGSTAHGGRASSAGGGFLIGGTERGVRPTNSLGRATSAAGGSFGGAGATAASATGDSLAAASASATGGSLVCSAATSASIAGGSG